MTSRVFDDIAEGLREAISVAKSEADPATYRLHHQVSLDVKSVRLTTGLTQRAFADRYGFSLGALRDWEQGRSHPDRVARSLLVIIHREPEAVGRALAVA